MVFGVGFETFDFDAVPELQNDFLCEILMTLKLPGSFGRLVRTVPVANSCKLGLNCESTQTIELHRDLGEQLLMPKGGTEYCTALDLLQQKMMELKANVDNCRESDILMAILGLLPENGGSESANTDVVVSPEDQWDYMGLDERGDRVVNPFNKLSYVKMSLSNISYMTPNCVMVGKGVFSVLEKHPHWGREARDSKLPGARVRVREMDVFVFNDKLLMRNEEGKMNMPLFGDDVVVCKIDEDTIVEQQCGVDLITSYTDQMCSCRRVDYLRSSRAKILNPKAFYFVRGVLDE